MSNWPNTCTLGGVLLDVSDGSSLRVVTAMTGWKDAPDVHPGLTPKAQQDGAWDGTGFDGPRTVNLAGYVQEATPQAAHQVQQQLAALRPQSTQEFVVVHTAIGSLSAITRVTTGVKTVWIGGNAFEYTLSITAPDPLKYGPPTFATATLSTSTPGAGRIWPRAWPTDWGIPAGVTPGAVAVANAGTAPYWLRLRVDGPSPNPTVSMVETGAWVRYGGVLLAGQYLDFDMANRRVLLQGQVSVRPQVSSSGDWLAVPVGGGSVAWTDDGGDPAARLSVWGFGGAWS
jgi:hypothetical protein